MDAVQNFIHLFSLADFNLCADLHKAGFTYKKTSQENEPIIS